MFRGCMAAGEANSAFSCLRAGAVFGSMGASEANPQITSLPPSLHDAQVPLCIAVGK